MDRSILGGEIMNTKISITKNGNYSPNKVFDFGYKYENVGDTLEFMIPTEYDKDYHYYLVFSMKKLEPIILPLNRVNGILTFYITSTITKNPGTYTFIFLATERQIVNGDIDNAKRVFVSNEMTGTVTDNFLNDPVNDEDLADKEYYDDHFGGETNLEIFYDSMRDLYLDLEDRVITGYYKGDFYLPYWKDDENVTLGWKHYIWNADKEVDGKKGIWEVYIKDENDQEVLIAETRDARIIPDDSMLRGFTGNHYRPLEEVTEDGNIQWKQYDHMNKPIGEEVPPTTNITTPIANATAHWMGENFDNLVDPKVKDAVEEKVDNTFKIMWNSSTKELFIYSAEELVTEVK